MDLDNIQDIEVLRDALKGIMCKCIKEFDVVTVLEEEDLKDLTDEEKLKLEKRENEGKIYNLYRYKTIPGHYYFYEIDYEYGWYTLFWDKYKENGIDDSDFREHFKNFADRYITN